MLGAYVDRSRMLAVLPSMRSTLRASFAWPTGADKVGFSAWPPLPLKSRMAEDRKAKTEVSATAYAVEESLNRQMDRYATGDDSVFADLHRELAPRLYRFLMRLSGSPAVAEELTQDAFLRMHRARAAFHVGGAALPWMYTIARNVFLDHERKRKVHGVVGLDEQKVLAQAQNASHEPDRVAEAREALLRVADALAKMPTSQREAFILVRFEGLSIGDAAEILGTTEASVKARAFRAYEVLRGLAEQDSRDASTLHPTGKN
jgi:RNA polymerase sigma-70 factor, ECF subfamily